jgi:hypothetical protein
MVRLLKITGVAKIVARKSYAFILSEIRLGYNLGEFFSHKLILSRCKGTSSPLEHSAQRHSPSTKSSGTPPVRNIGCNTRNRESDGKEREEGIFHGVNRVDDILPNDQCM